MILPPLVQLPISEKRPILWLNSHWEPIEKIWTRGRPNLEDVRAAERKLLEFAPLLMELFPELRSTKGLIESALVPADAFKKSFPGRKESLGRWFIKCDHALPIAGSIKARGGIYEVLLHAEAVALQAGIISPGSNRAVLASSRARALFHQHRIVVGSTGNLGLSIGIMANALGFQTTVYMSAEAKPWKKERLRACGVEVIEQAGSFGAAVSAGRERTRDDPLAYFVDDECSPHLFFGYSAAALRLALQLEERGVIVDATHPLFVHLPCGVGGSPGGITFGLRHLLGDHVHCFFAEPTGAPCMLLRLATVTNRPVSVHDVGLDGKTEADGLAVGQASEFVASLVRALVSGVFTVPDEHLFEDLYRVKHTEGLRIEPSAAAGFRGPQWLTESAAGREYLDRHDLRNFMGNASHILWATGGALVPEEEYQQWERNSFTGVPRGSERST